MGKGSKIAVGVAIAVIAAIIILFVNAVWNDYVALDYRLQGPNAFYVFNNYLDVNLYQGNSGNIGVVPTTEISVINATITGVSISNIAQFELHNYCQYNATEATISNLTAVKGSSLSNWATIHITPSNGTQSFSVSASVTLPSDLLHPKSTPVRNLPVELDYNRTSTDQYTLLQGQS
jgi:hypothetical protein